MSELKILSVSPSYYPAVEFGGPVTALRSLNKHLKDLNSEISVVTTTSGIESFENKYRLELVDGIQVNYFPTSRIFETLTPTGWQFSISLLLHLLKYAKNFDVIYCRSLWNFPTIACYLASIFNRKPLIIAATGKLTPKAFAIKSRKKRFFWNLLFSRLVRHANIHYVSEKEKLISEENIGIYGNGLVIETGTDLIQDDHRKISSSLKFSQMSQDTKKILFLGRVHPIKGLDLLVEMYSKVLRSEPDVALIISGPYEGNYHLKLKKIIQDLGLSFIETQPHFLKSTDVAGKVVFTGSVAGEVKNWILSSADIYCQLSISEGFSNSIIEAMAFSKPIVISKGCNFNHPDLHSFGFIVNDSSSAAEHILDLLRNEIKRAQYSEAAWTHVTQIYTWKEIAKKAHNLFQRISIDGKR